jgi:hypothetical protein
MCCSGSTSGMSGIVSHLRRVLDEYVRHDNGWRTPPGTGPAPTTIQPPGSRPDTRADQTPTGPRWPDQRVQTCRIEDQVGPYDGVMAPHRLRRRIRPRCRSRRTGLRRPPHRRPPRPSRGCTEHRLTADEDGCGEDERGDRGDRRGVVFDVVRGDVHGRARHGPLSRFHGSTKLIFCLGCRHKVDRWAACRGYQEGDVCVGSGAAAGRCRIAAMD